MINTELKKVVFSKLSNLCLICSSAWDNPKADLVYAVEKLTNEILDIVQIHSDDQAFKAVGECKHCYGKGYSSVLEPAHVASPDFEGDKRVVVKPSRLEYRFCQCERGQALKHLILTNAPWVLD